VAGYYALVTDISERVQAEERVSAILESITDGFISVDGDWRFTYLNAEAERACSLSRKDVLGTLWQDSFPEVFGSRVEAEMRRCMTEKTTVELESFYEPFGRWFWIKAYPTADGGFAQFFRDITQRKEDEERRNRQHQTFAEVVEGSPFGIYIVDSDFRIAMMNQGSQDSAFVNVNPAVGRNFEEAMKIIWPSDVAEYVIEQFRRTLETGEPFLSKDYMFPRADIEQVEAYEWELRRITMPDGRYAVVCYYYDSTKLRRAEEALAEQRRLHKAITDNAATALFIMDHDQQCVFMNPAAEAMTGYTVEEVQGRALHDVVHHTKPDGSPYPLSECPIDQAFPERSRMQGEEVFVHKNGSFYPVWFTASPLTNEAGEPIGTVIEVQDISERKAAQEALLAATAKFESVFNQSGIYAGIVDLDGRMLQVNDLAVDQCGYSREEAVGRLFWETPWWRGSEEVKQRVREGVEAALQGETFHEVLPYWLADGTEGVTDFRVHPIRDHEGNVTFIHPTGIDITDQRRAEEARQESDTRLRIALDAAKLGTWSWDAERDIVRYDDRTAAILGVKPGGVDSVERVLGGTVHPDDAPRLAKIIEESLASEEGRYMAEFRVLVNGEERWVLSHGRRADGKGFTGLIGTSQDITERKRREEQLRKLNEELDTMVQERTSELMQANEQLQGFTYSVAHDLRQQIRGISANASMLMIDAAEHLDSENQETLVRLAGNAKRLATLVDDLLTYARLGKQEPNLLPVDLSALAEEVAAYLIERGSCKQGTRFRVTPGMSARGDQVMLRIVLENLLENAAKYSSKRDAPVIEVGAEGDAFFVRDNGIGFDMRYADKLFQPFERLHRENEYSGTGIGLANVKRIVEKHGGRVWAEGAPGEGATIYFSLAPKA
jgi:PAS domain S-box-containing protein